MIDIQKAIEKYGACRHGILPFTNATDFRPHIEPCLLCKIERSKRWYLKPEARETLRRNAHDRLVRIYNISGDHTYEEWIERFEYWNKQCIKCLILLNLEDATEDHMIPSSWDQSSDSAWNIAPMCKSCNSSKRDWYAIYEYPEGSKQTVIVYKK